jgi:GGDEF domain-containing protein
MADPASPHRAPRARAVADLSCDALLARAEDLARGWAIAMIRVRPLEALGELALAELARDAPALCAQTLRAVQSDVELERLTGHGAPSGREQSAPAKRLAAISGAHDSISLVDAVEALRGVLWQALIDQLSEPSAREVGDIADRLAYVCAAVLTSALESAPPPAPTRGDDAHGAPGVSASATVTRELVHVPAAAGGAVIVDERARETAASPVRERLPASDELSSPFEEPAPALRASPAAERSLSWDESPPVPPRTAHVRARSLSWDEPSPGLPGAPLAEIEIRDERGEEGPAAWIGSIGAQLQRFERDALPFAVLLVELVELERLRRRESPEELLRLAAQVERALEAEGGGSSGSLTRERPGRCWLLAPATDRDGAERLAERLVRAVAASVSYRGEPVAVAIGTAVCPDDGREAAALAAHADVGLYAARTAARAPGLRRATPVDESA